MFSRAPDTGPHREPGQHVVQRRRQRSQRQGEKQLKRALAPAVVGAALRPRRLPVPRAPRRRVPHGPEEVRLDLAAVAGRLGAPDPEEVPPALLVGPRGDHGRDDGPGRRPPQDPRHEAVLHQGLDDAHVVEAERGAAAAQERRPAVGVPRLVEEGEAGLGRDGRGVAGGEEGDVGVADEVQRRADDVVVGLDQELGAGQRAGEEPLVQEAEVVPPDAAPEGEHEVEDVATAHQVDLRASRKAQRRGSATRTAEAARSVAAAISPIRRCEPESSHVRTEHSFVRSSRHHFPWGFGGQLVWQRQGAVSAAVSA